MARKAAPHYWQNLAKSSFRPSQLRQRIFTGIDAISACAFAGIGPFRFSHRFSPSGIGVEIVVESTPPGNCGTRGR